MIAIVCTPCRFGVRVMPTKLDPSSIRELEHLVGRGSSFWPDGYPCPRCGGKARGMLEQEVNPDLMAVLQLQEATPAEAFAAFNGLGFPDEQKCSLEAVQELLTRVPIVKVVGQDVLGMERALIDSFELQDGTRVYLGAGGEGVVIYRITRPVSYTQKALGAP